MHANDSLFGSTPREIMEISRELPQWTSAMTETIRSVPGWMGAWHLWCDCSAKTLCNNGPSPQGGERRKGEGRGGPGHLDCNASCPENCSSSWSGDCWLADLTQFALWSASWLPESGFSQLLRCCPSPCRMSLSVYQCPHSAQRKNCLKIS